MALVSIAEQNRSLDLYYGADKGAIASAAHELALYAGDPLTGGVELDSAGGYARVLVSNDGTSWPDPADGGAKTAAPVAYATSTDAWTVAGDPAVATHFQFFAVDTGDAGDSGLLADEVSVDAAGVTPSVAPTVFYNNESGA